MKKILGLLSIFLGIDFILSFIACFIIKVPFAVPDSSAFGYRLLTGLDLFLKYFPAVIMTGFVVSFAVYFGRNSEGSVSRFSANMMKRFRLVMISAIIIAAVLTLNSEIFVNMTNAKKISIINQPKIINEYIKVGNNLFDNGYYERAMRYAEAALKLNPNNSAASALRDKADVENNKAQTKDIRSKLYKSVEAAEKVDRVDIDSDCLSEVYECYKKASEEFCKGNWINAHYFAELGIEIATPKDPNLEKLRQISTEAWNNLSDWYQMDKTEEQKIFDRKYEGYLALVEHDDLKAYYIFRELYYSTRELHSDPDVIFYMNIAENRIKQRHFFIDETFELASFENANDVYFSYKYADGSTDVVYCKGVTIVEETGNSIQYLRDLTIISLNKKGEWVRTVNVPYAKVLPVSVKNLNPVTKELLGLRNKPEYIPYLILKSVGREKPYAEVYPRYTYANGEYSKTPEYLLLPIDYKDFLMLENSTHNPENIPLGTLYRLAFKADDFGFSTEVFGQVLINRIYFPFWVIIIFIILATFAWHNRIAPTQYFKMTWALAFPLFFVVSHFFYRGMLFLFKLLNYAIIGRMSITSAFIFVGVMYLCCFIIASLGFLGSRAKE